MPRSSAAASASDESAKTEKKSLTPAEQLASLRKQLRGAELARDSAELNVQKFSIKIQRVLAKNPELDLTAGAVSA